ncbi:Ribonuclease Z [Candidatus Tiddalikarchaeum anstoanum]|nr:Ribonuclease Z [Candidatus Tiddalikarchaeum anstoanum]
MLDIDLFVLGTSSQFPTKERNHSGFFLRFGTFQALFDCGEGTQRQMRIMGLSPHHVNALFISHWHGDHSLGIGGIIQSLSASKRDVTLDIYGPIGTKERIDHIMNTYYFKKSFPIHVHEFNPKSETLIVEHDKFFINCFPLNHGIPCLGYSFQTKPERKINLSYVKKFGLTKDPVLGKLQRGETITYKGHVITPEQGTFLKDGKKLCFIFDTKYFDDLISFARNSDLLISEGTFSKSDEELCEDYDHLSNSQAAMIAKKSVSKKLLITHISQRYNDTKKLEKEIKPLFKESSYAKDFDKITI